MNATIEPPVTAQQPISAAPLTTGLELRAPSGIRTRLNITGAELIGPILASGTTQILRTGQKKVREFQEALTKARREFETDSPDAKRLAALESAQSENDDALHHAERHLAETKELIANGLREGTKVDDLEFRIAPTETEATRRRDRAKVIETELATIRDRLKSDAAGEVETIRNELISNLREEREQAEAALFAAIAEPFAKLAAVEYALQHATTQQR